MFVFTSMSEISCWNVVRLVRIDSSISRGALGNSRELRAVGLDAAHHFGAGALQREPFRLARQVLSDQLLLVEDFLLEEGALLAQAFVLACLGRGLLLELLDLLLEDLLALDERAAPRIEQRNLGAR